MSSIHRRSHSTSPVPPQASSSRPAIYPRLEPTRSKKPRPDYNHVADTLQGHQEFLRFVADGIHAAWYDGDATIPDYLRPSWSLGYAIDAAAQGLAQALDLLSMKFPGRELDPLLKEARTVMGSEERLTELSIQEKETFFREAVCRAHHLVHRLTREFFMAEVCCRSFDPSTITRSRVEQKLADCQAHVDALLPLRS